MLSTFTSFLSDWLAGASLLCDTRSSSREKYLSWEAESNDPGLDPGFYLIEKPLIRSRSRFRAPRRASCAQRRDPRGKSWREEAPRDKEMSCHRVPYNAARAPFDRGTLAVATRVAGYAPREFSARRASKTRRSLDRRRRANVVPLLPFSRHWGLIGLPLESRRRSRTAPPKPARWRSR